MDTASSPSPPSTFVTVLAWLGIVLSSFALVGSVMQIVLIFAMPSFGGQQPFARMQLLVLGAFGTVVLALAASIGLLHRKRWARLTIVVLLLACIVGVVWALHEQWGMLSHFADQDMPADADFARVARVMRYYSLVMTVALSAIAAWLTAKLCSKRVRDEFLY